MLLTVTLDRLDDPLVVRTRPADNILYEETARRHRWGKLDENPMRYLYFLAFAACCRLGHADRAAGFDAFVDELVDVDLDDEEEDAGDRPTRPGPGLA